MAMGAKKKGLTREEIISATGLRNSGGLTMKLEELESCGFIRRYPEFGKKKRDSVYQLTDNFTLFYYQFMADRPGDENFWQNQINQPAVNTWQGFAFERVCLEHTWQMKKKLGESRSPE